MGLDCTIWQITMPQLAELLDSDEAGSAWHVLHFCITGEAEGNVFPLSYALMAGIPIADDYIEGAVYLLPHVVSGVATALGTLPDALIVKRFKDEACGNREVYASQWAEDRSDEMVTYFDRLKQFYHEAAGKSSALLRHIG
jgi:hypothetical protein